MLVQRIKLLCGCMNVYHDLPRPQNFGQALAVSWRPEVACMWIEGLDAMEQEWSSATREAVDVFYVTIPLLLGLNACSRLAAMLPPW